MKFVKDLYLELDTDFPGHDGKLYNAHTFRSYVSGDQSRGFLELTTPTDDHESSRSFIMEMGGSDISIALRNGGEFTADRLKVLKEEYLDGMRSEGIDPKRLTEIPAETFEQAADIILGQSHVSTPEARSHAIKQGFASTPGGFEM